MLTSLRGRLWASYALTIVVALSVAAIFLLLYLLRNPVLYRQAQGRLQAAAALVKLSDVRGAKGSLEGIQDAASLFDVRIVLFSSEGAVLLDTTPGGAAMPFPKTGPFARVSRALRDANGRSWLYFLEKRADGSWLMVSALRPRLSILAFVADELLPLFAVGGLIALLLSLGVSYLLARWIAVPLEQIVTAAGMASPQPVNMSPGSGPREVRELSRAFNGMLQRIHVVQAAQRNLIADVSHELKTPLTSIQGFAQAILDHTADTPESQMQAVRVIQSESLRMQRLVTELLDLARLEAGSAEMARVQVDLSDILRAVAERLRPQIAATGTRLDFAGFGTPLLVMGDSERLLQVFSNVVENAVKYSPPGGEVRVAACVEAAWVEISVSDTGQGISESDVPRIFDRFFQADPSRQRGRGGGAGLGLAIAREIVRAHDGRITVQSLPGQGTTITVRLPAG
jgi:signal transduction histidine kinase